MHTTSHTSIRELPTMHATLELPTQLRNKRLIQGRQKKKSRTGGILALTLTYNLQRIRPKWIPVVSNMGGFSTRSNDTWHCSIRASALSPERVSPDPFLSYGHPQHPVAAAAKPNHHPYKAASLKGRLHPPRLHPAAPRSLVCCLSWSCYWSRADAVGKRRGICSGHSSMCVFNLQLANWRNFDITSTDLWGAWVEVVAESGRLGRSHFCVVWWNVDGVVAGQPVSARGCLPLSGVWRQRRGLRLNHSVE